MIDGIYAVNFRSGRSHGDGIVVVSENKIHGGDFAYTYRGTIDAANPPSVSGALHVKRHAAGQSVFGPIDEFNLEFRGSYGSGIIEFTAYMTSPMSAQMNINARKISDLVN